MGHSRPKWAVCTMSGLPPLATELRTSLVVRLVPILEVMGYANSELRHQHFHEWAQNDD
jgi:hypothetical protein